MTPVAKPRTDPVIRSLIASLTVEAQNILGGSAPDDDEIDHDRRVHLNHCSLILYIHAPVRTSYVHVRMCITLQDPGT